MLAAPLFLLGYLLLASTLWTDSQGSWRADLRSAFALASLLIALACSVVCELAGSLGSLNRETVSVFWILVFLSLALRGLGRRTHCLSFARACLRELRESPLFFSLGFLVLLCTAASGLLSQPNNYDSLSFHLTRVFFWAQHHSLAPFATENLRQIEGPPLNSEIFLHLWYLGMGRGCPLVQNFFLWTLLLPMASVLMQHLGADKRTRLLGCLSLLTCSVIVLQSSSTQNNLLVSAFITAVPGFACLALNDDSRWSWLALAVSTGLAMLSKGTALLLLPFLGLHVLFLHRKTPWQVLLRGFLLVSLCCAVLNLPHILRTMEVSGLPFGSWSQANKQAHIGLAPTLSVLTKNIALHLPVFDQDSAHLWERLTTSFSQDLLQIDINLPGTMFFDYNFMLLPLWGHEDCTGSFLFLFLVTLSLGILVKRCLGPFRTRRPVAGTCEQPLLVLGLLLLLSFCAYSALLNWTVWGARLQTPFLTLGLIWAAPIWARPLASARRASLAAAALFCLALPLLLMANQRPLVGKYSVFTTPEAKQWFMYIAEAGDGFEALEKEMHRLKPSSVALYVSNNYTEFPLLSVLRKANPRVWVDHIMVSNPSSQYLKRRHYDLIYSENNQGERIHFGGVPYQRHLQSSQYTLYLPARPLP